MTDDNLNSPLAAQDLGGYESSVQSAPLPTTQTLRARRNPVVQLGKFLAFDLRIMRMVVKAKD